MTTFRPGVDYVDGMWTLRAASKSQSFLTLEQLWEGLANLGYDSSDMRTTQEAYDELELIYALEEQFVDSV